MRLAAAPRGRDTGHVTRDKNTRPDTGHGEVPRSPCRVTLVHTHYTYTQGDTEYAFNHKVNKITVTL